MSSKSVLNRFVNLRKQNKKAFAVLIDPDNTDMNQIIETAQLCNEAKVDFVFIGGSLMLSNHLDECIKTFKSKSSIPVILFPGSPSQVSKEADALLYLALISGRNPELLIGAHVVSAPKIKASGLEIISTGYIVVDGGKPTAVSYMSNSAPIPYDKDDIAVCTAIAGEFLGKNVLYMDAGSGAINPVSENMIQKVSNQISIPLIVGGGISSPEKAIANCQAGADIIVVGNALEKDNQLIKILAEAIHSC
jgi:putative glycerol-1-phosphate prenyltransferase